MKWGIHFFVFLIFIPFSLGQGIAVSPSSLTVDTEAGKESIAQLTLFNPSQHDFNYLFAAKEHPEFFVFSNGKIERDSKREVSIIVSVPKGTSAGKITDTIIVYFFPSGTGEISISPGISIKADISILAEPEISSFESAKSYFNGRNVSIALASLALLGVLVYYVFFDDKPGKRDRRKR